MRRFTYVLAVTALGLSSVLGAGSAASALQAPEVTAQQCIDGGGHVVYGRAVDVCYGGRYHGRVVLG
ncbi:hypothetical protein ACF1GT_01295 [Streptomyces sp. NPDC014636]|uniref:hypothetical protein n=1 Tax=Streptomyces sp. NPDC014636 TaxID=3364876 RepID=UPI0036F81A16